MATFSRTIVQTLYGERRMLLRNVQRLDRAICELEDERPTQTERSPRERRRDIKKRSRADDLEEMPEISWMGEKFMHEHGTKEILDSTFFSPRRDERPPMIRDFVGSRWEFTPRRYQHKLWYICIKIALARFFGDVKATLDYYEFTVPPDLMCVWEDMNTGHISARPFEISRVRL